MELIDTNAFKKKKELATNKDTPLAILRELVTNESRWIRCHVARNPNIPEDCLQELARDKSSFVRTEVADNPRTPKDILHDFAKNEIYTAVLVALVLNPNTPKDSLRDYLKKSGDPSVRHKLAQSSDSSSTLLVMIFEHEKNLKEPSKYVIKALYNNAKLPLFAKRIIETLYEEML